MLKKYCALLIIICLLCPCLAGAAEAVQADFDIDLQMYPEAFPVEQAETAQKLTSGLDMLGLKGILTKNENGWLDLAGQVLVGGESAFSVDMRSTGRWVEVSSDLLGDTTLSLYMDAYLEFMLKPYNFMGVKTQYLGLVTSPYATREPWTLFMNVVNRYCGGEGTRQIETDALIACAYELADFVDTNRDMTQWLMAALMDVGLDSTVSDFFYSFPEWLEENADEEGLLIEIEGDTATWTLANSTIVTHTHSDGEEKLIISLPDWCGIAFKFAYMSTPENETLTILLSSEDEGTMLDLKAKAIGLPVKELKKGITDLSLSISGGYVTAPINETARIDWEWDSSREPEMLEAAFHWLNPKNEPKLTVNAHLALREGDKRLFDHAESTLRAGVHFFSLYEETLANLISDIRQPLIEKLIPLYFKLPVPFLEVLIDWFTKTGISDMLLSFI